MKQMDRSNLLAGIILILIGGVILVGNLAPQWFGWFSWATNWPLMVMGLGALFLVLGALTRTPAMAVPACLIGGIGGILYWQNATGNWASWSYIWTLIPGFVGVGIILAGFLSGTVRSSLREGSRTLMVSLVMFAIFGSFLGPHDFSGLLLPAVVIVAGVVILLESILRRR